MKRMELVDDFDMSLIDSELEGDIDLGFMLYGLKFDDGGKPVNGDWENPIFSDIASPLYYRPHMINGVIDVGKYREGIIC